MYGDLTYHDADLLEKIHEREDFQSLYNRQSHLDFESNIIPVIAMRWDESLERLGCTFDADKTVVAYVQDRTFNPNIATVNSYGIRCLIEDIFLRGISNVPQASSNKVFIVESVSLWKMYYGEPEGIAVKIRLRDYERRRYGMEIRYKMAWKDVVLGILIRRSLVN
ncbi:hypothetical protein SCHPADRAFT_891752 [Schizopora paradoxa]|uniref:Uncharacterized protein n=1 Tax=Schizopora paradoxa TaxID=27342 RepID=A0A0H2RNZ0_9AGAM|nr:hypothetical protein SCHPADRAFT_891752 [Schizopora paradoxa]